MKAVDYKEAESVKVIATCQRTYHPPVHYTVLRLYETTQGRFEIILLFLHEKYEIVEKIALVARYQICNCFRCLKKRELNFGWREKIRGNAGMVSIGQWLDLSLAGKKYGNLKVVKILISMQVIFHLSFWGSKSIKKQANTYWQLLLVQSPVLIDRWNSKIKENIFNLTPIFSYYQISVYTGLLNSREQ